MVKNQDMGNQTHTHKHTLKDKGYLNSVKVFFVIVCVCVCGLVCVCAALTRSSARRVSEWFASYNIQTKNNDPIIRSRNS